MNEEDETISDESISPEQLNRLLKAFPNVQRFIARRLGKTFQASVEDLKQKVFLKLWQWHKKKKLNENGDKDIHGANINGGTVDLSGEDWQKLALAVARNEVNDFFREKYTRRNLPFSQMNKVAEERVFSVPSNQILEGNSRAELCSQMRLVWRAAQVLSSARQKYAYFLAFPDFIIEFIVCECCSIKELAEYFETDENSLSEIVGSLPFSDEEIGKLLKRNFGERLAQKQIWEARAKAKKKLAQKLAEYLSDGRLFDQRRS